MVQILIPENFNLGLFAVEFFFFGNQYISDVHKNIDQVSRTDGLSWTGLHNSLIIDD